ncbi:hypothetical protein V5F77_04195 [Xanthobacter sp. DSM 24535]|uniref:ParB/RepB/Spo0J family partition protein n=1 Tax=Roseixanthobacter psychrophilus TaxID=3119917 RepID=UPI003726BFC9
MTEPAKKQGGIKDIALGRQDIFRLAPSDIHIREGWNVREETPELAAHIDGIALSMSKIGVKDPLRVWWEDGKAWVSDGHNRIRAVRRAMEVYGADIKSVPVLLEDRYSSEADRKFSQKVLNGGLPISTYEEGKLYKQMRAYGWTEKDIADNAGISTTRVAQVLSLQAAPLEVQHMVVAGEVSASLAIDTLRQAPEPQAAAETLQAAVATAKAAGKTKATAKHLPASVPRTGLKAELRDLFEGAATKSEGGVTTLEITDEEHERLKKLLGL